MTMASPAADRNLIFGLLALQMDFVTREQLLALIFEQVHTWNLLKSRFGGPAGRSGRLKAHAKALSAGQKCRKNGIMAAPWPFPSRSHLSRLMFTAR